jgi:hypothetical protein
VIAGLDWLDPAIHLSNKAFLRWPRGAHDERRFPRLCRLVPVSLRIARRYQ